MEGLLWSMLGICIVIIVILLAKLRQLQKAAKEIREHFADRILTETNTVIDISCNDKYMRKLANDINIQLRKLRSERHRFQQGDKELKNVVTNISHDLRTPLTAICGYLDLLEQEEKSQTVERYIGVIKNRTELLKYLTEELFRYSILMSTEQEIKKEQVVLNYVLEESIAVFYTDFKKRKMTPMIQLPEEKIVRTLDKDMLSRVIANLLQNTIKYSEGDLKIILLKTGEMVFTNTVQGLNEVQVEKLFDRFYTVETAQNATGLGLTIARTLVERMNGTITAYYENNQLSIRIFFADTLC